MVYTMLFYINSSTILGGINDKQGDVTLGNVRKLKNLSSLSYMGMKRVSELNFCSAPVYWL